MTKKEDVANRCKQLRIDAGFSQVELAELMDIDKTRISAIENAKVYIREAEAKAYASHFNLPISQFLTSKEAMVVTRYRIVDAIDKLRNQLGDKFSYGVISRATGIPKTHLYDLSRPSVPVYATPDEIKTITNYFNEHFPMLDVTESFFMEHPKDIPVCKARKEKDVPEKNEIKKEVEVSVEPVETNTGYMVSSSWRDKAHELQKEVNRLKNELELVKSNQEIQDNDELCAVKEELGRFKASSEYYEKTYRDTAATLDMLKSSMETLEHKIEKYKDVFIKMILEKYDLE